MLIDGEMYVLGPRSDERDHRCAREIEKRKEARNDEENGNAEKSA